MRIRRCQTALLAALALLAPLADTLAAKGETFQGAFQMRSGQVITLPLVGGSAEIETDVGRLRYPLERVAYLSGGTREGEFTLVTQAGDRVIGLLTKFDATPPEDTDLPSVLKRLPEELHSFSTVRHATLPYRHHRARVLLRQGGRIHVDRGSDLRVGIRQGDSLLEVPITAPRATKLFAASEANRHWCISTSFPGGHIYSGELASPSRALRFRDLYGNRLSVPVEDVEGIIGSPSIPEGVAANGPTGTAKISLRAEPPIRATIPMVCWTISSDAGEQAIPAAVTTSLVRDNHERHQWVLTTAYGETFVGKLAKRRVTAETGTTPAQFQTRDMEAIRADLPELPLPQGWLVFKFADGTRAVGQFPDTDELFDPSDDAPALDQISEIHPLDGDLQVVAMDGSKTTQHPRRRSIEILFLSSGTMEHVSWSDILECSGDFLDPVAPVRPTHRKPPRPDRGGAPSLRNPSQDETGDQEPGDQVEERPAAQDLSTSPKGLDIRSGLGDMKLPIEAVASILNADADGSLLMLTDGSTIMASDLSERSSEKWAKRNGLVKREVPADRTLWTTERMPGATVDTLQVRLTTGEAFSVRKTGRFLFPSTRRGGGDLDIATADLVACRRDDEGKLLVYTTAGPQRIATDRGTLEVRLAATGALQAVPLERIAFIDTTSLSALPFATSAATPASYPELAGMAFIPAGTYLQGRREGVGMPDETPAHEVVLPPFWMDKTEVTRALFAAFVRETGYKTVAELMGTSETWRAPGFPQTAAEPVVCVAWHDAAAFCNWRSRKSGLTPCYEIRPREAVVTDRTANGYRLPTESEWEYAAREEGLDITYPWGDAPAHKSANFRPRDPQGNQDSWEWTNPVMAFPPNSLGIYGLGGNVWEWCEDTYSPRAYSVLKQTRVNPCHQAGWQESSTHRVLRGGSYQNEVALLATRSRGHGLSFASNSRTGFRCVRNAARH